MFDHSALLSHFVERPADGVAAPMRYEALIRADDREEFLALATKTLEETALSDILVRAITFYLGSATATLEISIVSLFVALESMLTFFRRQDEYDIIEPEQFSALERDLKKWLKQQPALAQHPDKRALIYEKFRELNRFPFSHIFNKFCEHYSLDLSDLWPLAGKHADWPLSEVRHRLVHGDPFASRPPEALACAQAHLRWTVERMLLSVFGWSIERSNVSSAQLQRSREYQSWPAERSKFA